MAASLPFFLMSVLLFSTPSVLLAAEFRSGDQVGISQGETVAEDMYATGSTVTAAGSITGDLYAGAGTVVLSGTVSQDAVIGGGTVTLLGSVGDDIRIGGGTVVVQGRVGGDALIGGGQVTLGGEGIEGDTIIGAGSVSIEAPIRGDVRVAGGDILINSTVAGNVEIKGENIHLGPRAVLEGTLTYESPREVEMAEGAVVRGEVVYKEREERSEAALAGLLSLAFFAKFLMLLAGALIFGLLFRRSMQEIVRKARTRPLLEFGRGLVALIVIPVVCLILFVTVVGIPLGVLGMLSYIALLIFAWFAAPVILGSILYQWWMRRELEVSFLSVLLGVVVYTMVGILPILGGLAQLALISIALGATIKLKWDIAKE